MDYRPRHRLWMNPHVSAAIRASWLPHTFTPYCLRHLGTLCWSQYSSQLYSQRINGFLASYSPDSNTRSNNFNTIFWIRCEKLKPCWQRKLAPGRTKLMTAWPTEKCRSSSLRLTCHSLHMFKSDKIFVLFRHHFGLISTSTSTLSVLVPNRVIRETDNLCELRSSQDLVNNDFLRICRNKFKPCVALS